MDGVPPANLLGGWKSGHIVAATPFCPGQGWTYSVFPELRRAELAPSGSHAINCENIWDRRGVKAERKRRRSQEHTSELQSLMRTSYAALCLTKKNQKPQRNTIYHRT